MLTALFTLGLNMIVVFVFILAFGVDADVDLAALPADPAAAAGPAPAALSMLLSALNVRFRDVAIIWVVVATALFYGTPVIYPLSIVHGALKHLLMVNPLTPIFQQAHIWMIEPGTAPKASTRPRRARCT